ncbi:MAG: methyl-accepting chemotaxis protein [Desulfobacula sp.]|jgi:methyl-accepting chemotaxis protein|nr:methyl-accepting chemotaxis protein [Desulfobacula sp.]
MGYRKRRKYIVHSRFQLKFALGFIIAALVGGIFSTALFNYLAMIKLEQLQWSVHVSASSTGEVLKQIFLYVNGINLIFVSILFAITGFWMLKKINGPVYRIIKSLELIKKGDLSRPVILRQKDEFGNVAKNIDEMREQIRRRFVDSKKMYETISQSLQDMEKDLINGKQIDEQIGETGILVRRLQKQNQYDQIEPV